MWLTLEEVCVRTRLSESTIERWIKEGYLVPGIHYGGKGRLRRFDQDMVDFAVRFQEDPQAHEQAIAAKRRELFGRRWPSRSPSAVGDRSPRSIDPA